MGLCLAGGPEGRSQTRRLLVYIRRFRSLGDKGKSEGVQCGWERLGNNNMKKGMRDSRIWIHGAS